MHAPMVKQSMVSRPYYCPILINKHLSLITSSATSYYYLYMPDAYLFNKCISAIPHIVVSKQYIFAPSRGNAINLILNRKHLSAEEPITRL